MKFKKFPLVEIVLSVVGIFISVAAFVLIQIAGKVNGASTGATPLAIVELVLFVLMVAALTAQKIFFAKIVSIVSLAILMFSTFVTAIVCSVEFQSYAVSWDTISFLTISILALVSVVLFFIYFLIGKKDMLKKLSSILNFFSLGFFAVFAILVIISCFAGCGKGE